MFTTKVLGLSLDVLLTLLRLRLSSFCWHWRVAFYSIEVFPPILELGWLCRHLAFGTIHKVRTLKIGTFGPSPPPVRFLYREDDNFSACVLYGCLLFIIYIFNKFVPVCSGWRLTNMLCKIAILKINILPIPCLRYVYSNLTSQYYCSTVGRTTAGLVFWIRSFFNSRCLVTYCYRCWGKPIKGGIHASHYKQCVAQMDFDPWRHKGVNQPGAIGAIGYCLENKDLDP